MDVRDVHLHRGELRQRQRVEQRVARVRVRAGVDDDAVGRAHGGVNGLHERALMVGLEAARLDAERLRLGGERRLHVLQGERAVLRRIAPAEHVEIRPVDQQDGLTSGLRGAGNPPASLIFVAACSESPPYRVVSPFWRSPGVGRDLRARRRHGSRFRCAWAADDGLCRFLLHGCCCGSGGCPAAVPRRRRAWRRRAGGREARAPSRFPRRARRAGRCRGRGGP